LGGGKSRPGTPRIRGARHFIFILLLPMGFSTCIVARVAVLADVLPEGFISFVRVVSQNF